VHHHEQPVGAQPHFQPGKKRLQIRRRPVISHLRQGHEVELPDRKLVRQLHPAERDVRAIPASHPRRLQRAFRDIHAQHMAAAFRQPAGEHPDGAADLQRVGMTAADHLKRRVVFCPLIGAGLEVPRVLPAGEQVLEELPIDALCPTAHGVAS